MPSRLFHPLFAFALAVPSLVACGDEDPPPAFTVRAISNNVALGATELLQLRLDPREGAFRDEPVGEFLPGLASRLEGPTLVIEANAGFITANQATPPPNALFAVDVPIWATPELQGFTGMTPLLQAVVRRAGEPIADSGEASDDKFLPLPLDPADGPLTIRFQCRTVPGPGGDPMPLPQCAAPSM